MELRLVRYGFHPAGTFGFLQVANLSLCTIERPWRGNEPRISCIPDGIYTLETHSTTRFPQTWAFVGETVSHWPSIGKRRSACIFHAANWSHQLQGCIAPGLRAGFLASKPAILSSGEAMSQLRRVLGWGTSAATTHTIEIVRSEEVNRWQQ